MNKINGISSIFKNAIFSKSSPAKSTRRFSMIFDSLQSRDRQFSQASGIIQVKKICEKIYGKTYGLYTLKETRLYSLVFFK